MNVPIYYNFRFVDENGYLTQEAQFFMSTLNQAMLGALTDNGWTVPQHTTAEITVLAASDFTPLGTIWFNTTLAKLQVKTAASTVETVSSS